MSSFYGTIEDVSKFLMPRIRNKVQTLARPYKNLENGVCQHCGRKNGTLEAAHVHGRERKTIVRKILEKYRSGNGYHIVDLDLFEGEVIEAHEPIEETFLFLCHDCHRAYDDHNGSPYCDRAMAANASSAAAASSQQAELEASQRGGRARSGGVLPIGLTPSKPVDFERAFLDVGVAEIREYYADGHCESKPWRKRASGGFSETSRVMSNLRSRKEYRQGAWQAKGIVRLEVVVTQ